MGYRKVRIGMCVLEGAARTEKENNQVIDHQDAQARRGKMCVLVNVHQ